jgi:hypothetical protein
MEIDMAILLGGAVASLAGHRKPRCDDPTMPTMAPRLSPSDYAGGNRMMAAD